MTQEQAETSAATCKHVRIDVRRMREGEREVACHECGKVFCVIPDAK